MGFTVRYQVVPSAVRKLNKAIYRLVHAGRWRNTKLAVDLQGMRLDQFQVDLCMFKRVANDGEAEIFVIFHLGDILVAAHDTATLKKFVVELHGKFATIYGVSNHVFPGGRYNQVRLAYLRREHRGTV